MLAKLTDAKIDHADFPYLTGRHLDLGFAPVLALRATYVGELGVEVLGQRFPAVRHNAPRYDAKGERVRC